jgi:hypothetical protein
MYLCIVELTTTCFWAPKYRKGVYLLTYGLRGVVEKEGCNPEYAEMW